MLLVLLGCGQPAEEPEEVAPATLPAPRLLRRISLDLRGALPSTAELDAVEADPDQLAVLAETYLADPRLEDRVVALLAEQWHTRVDAFDVTFFDYGLDPEEEFAFERAVGEEPLRLAARIVAEDRPWTDLVTADHTMANELLAGIWPLDYPDGATGWQEATYTDSRPMAGVLSTNGLWWRYTTTDANMNRGRAAAISRLLLCEDYLGRPVSFSGRSSLSSSEGTEDAVHSEPACLGCHSAIDPLAATLFGFWWLAQYSVEEETVYHGEREPLGPAYLGVEPAYFGAPIGSLAELGPHVAADPRYTTCAVETFAEGLLRRELDSADRALLADLRDRFVEEGRTVRPLLAALTSSDAYRDPDATPRLLTPEQIATVLAEQTGYTWTASGYEQLANDAIGYRVLAGGVDGSTVFRPQSGPGLTWALVVERVAAAAAAHAVSEPGGLVADPTAPADDDALETLHWRLLAERPDAEQLEALRALWSAVEAEAGPEEAWTAVLTVLFRDPRFVTS